MEEGLWELSAFKNMTKQRERRPGRSTTSAAPEANKKNKIDETLEVLFGRGEDSSGIIPAETAGSEKRRISRALIRTEGLL